MAKQLTMGIDEPLTGETTLPVAFSREWAMPSKATFTIPPIARLLGRYVSPSALWIDPFAGWNSPATVTNDINPEAPTDYHEMAWEFLKRFKNADGVLFDPPYSPRQVAEHYRSAGLTATQWDTSSGLIATAKNAVAECVRAGGLVISCGWNSNGVGKKRGFDIVEIMLVAHGGAHNDTIVTVERKRPQ